MKTYGLPLPTIRDLAQLFISLKTSIGDEYRATNDSADNTPGMCVTIGWSDESGEWSYQTGDNSFTGGAYSFPHWAICYLHRRSDSRALARDAVNQLADLASQ
jgi:hypothetical protein